MARLSNLYEVRWKRDQKLIKFLLDHAENFCRASDVIRITPLHHAVVRGNLEIVMALVDKKVDVNDLDRCNYTPLHRALARRNKKIVKFLLNHGADLSIGKNNYLVLAAEWGNEEIIKALLDKNPDVDHRGHELTTPLHNAARSGNLKIVKFLLDQGADPNARDKYKNTSLHFAAEERHSKIFRILLDRGADPNARDITEQTLLHLAADVGCESIVKTLLDINFDINAVDKFNDTPLIYAICSNSIKMVQFLLDQGANLNIRSKDGSSPLHVAADLNCREITKILLDEGSEVFIKDKNGMTPLDLLRGPYDIERSIAEDISIHLVKLKVAGLDRNEGNLHVPSPHTLQGIHPWERLLKERLLRCNFECRKELKELKSKRLGENVSLYNVLITKNPRYILNKELSRDMKSLNINEFPLYGGMLKSKFRRDFKRFELFEACKRPFAILMRKAGGKMLPALPSEIVEKIISNLDNRDLQNLALCIRQK